MCKPLSIGAIGVSKRLDKFLVTKRVTEEADRMKTWVGEGIASNDLPILLHIIKDENKPSRSFKFNPKWMEMKTLRVWLLNPRKYMILLMVIQ